MAKQNVKNEGDERLESIETTLSKTELFIANNQKTIIIVLAVLAIAVLAVFGVKKFYLEPREKEAQTAIYHAEQYFENDNFATALNGDGNYLGFVDIINDFGGTKTANLAKYYAGICNLNTGDFNQAVSYLKDFKGKDVLVSSLALGALADAYMELDKVAEAAAAYEKAANKSENTLTSPMYLLRAGMAYEMAGNYQQALNVYNKIKKDYPTSNEGFSIEKYIARAQAEMK
ncbi:MAG: tetratricopeptide repeat protein [Lentimicrobiaceae bacterium]|nr:tetratricopeptide repeat protein [Lentimicrobiaceae bacterium]